LRVVLSPSGEAAEYLYDAAGNITAVRRPGANDPFEVLTFTPTRGPFNTLVTIYCFGLSAGATALSFNGANAQIVSANAISVVARVPPNATTGPLTVVTPRGTGTTRRSFDVQGISLRLVAGNAEFTRRETNRAFVLMQYFGYLRRNPDEAPDSTFAGWQFWLTKLNQSNGNFIEAEMVNAFLQSNEYRSRFGPP
jgi:hypothetical protein